MNSKFTYTLSELAEKIGAQVDGDGSLKINSAAPVDDASEGAITFIANAKYIKHLESTKASAIILDADTPASNISVLRHNNPYLAFAMVIDILFPELPDVYKGIHASAVIEENVLIADDARIGPFTHICKGSSVGSETRIVSSVYIGRNVSVGSNCIIYPGVRIMDDTVIGNNVIIHSSTVLGSDGFGFAESDTGLKKIKQIGNVVIEDHVEIGSNCSVDRAALGSTKIGMGTKIDNLVQIGHNVQVGRHSIIVSQVGISGSTKIGNGVILAGQVGVAGHLEVGDGVQVGAQSGIAKSVPPGSKIFGSPARDILLTMRIEASLSRLPELFRRVKKLEQSK